MALTGHMPNSIWRADSHGKRLFDSALAGSASLITALRTSRDFGPAIAKTPHWVVTSCTSNRAKLRHFVGDRLAQVVAVIIGPSACRDEVIFILGQPHDGVFGARGACGGQRIGQIDAAHARQFVGGEPIQKRRRARAFDGVFGERSGIDQTNTLADGACLIHCILPPTTATKAAGVMIKGSGASSGPK